MAKRAEQQELRGKGLKKPSDKFGGSLLKGNPKAKRPIVTKLPIHVTLRAKQGGMRHRDTIKEVNALVYQTAKKHGVKVYEFANVGNHLHILLKLTRLQSWPAFIRELTGRIAQTVMQALARPERVGFWLHRPFTRIIRSWKNAYRDVKEYVFLNHLEAEGFIDRRETKTLKDLHAIWQDG